MKIIDMHCDTISRIYKTPDSQLRQNNFQLDLMKMKSSRYLLQNFAMFIDLDETEQPYETCHEQIRIFKSEMAKTVILLHRLLLIQKLWKMKNWEKCLLL